MHRAISFGGITLLLLAAATVGRGEVFLRGNGGWLEEDVYKTDTAGSPFLGGPGWSVEAGFGLSRSLVLSFEYGPSYRQPKRDIPESDGFEDGSYRMMMGNLAFRLEPIERVEPYLIIGGGQGVFTFDYGDTGRVFTVGGGERRVMEEDLKGWIVSAGFGFETPIASWLTWGARGRFLYHRWQASTDTGRFLAFESGNGYTLEGTLRIRF